MATILAIETSCDETAAAVLKNFDVILAHEIFSQARIHSEFGGVVPEVASRNHLASAPHIVELALEKSGVALSDLDAIAATTGPGLASALLVGAALAKGLAIGAAKSFLAVNHIEGHLLSPFFGREKIPPHTALVVSGGHTLLLDVEGFRNYRLLGRTLDDAAGEAFDKTAKLLGLGYPGGIAIDKLAATGDAARYDFPRGMIDSGDFDFSFSGLKTSVRVFLEKHGTPTETDLPDLCASFQAAVVDVLAAKLLRAARQNHRNAISVSGGVSANSRLRQTLEQLARREGLELHRPPPDLLTDNALMIAFAAAHHFAAGRTSSVTTEISPNFRPSDFSRIPSSPSL
ncbi:MAG: tRNA (adenosine(37)-N6)-threonylcarbamoyltransferase complex transferase subunit TsaD [Verrucomicrobiota bacterium]